MTEQEHKSWFARLYQRFWYVPDILLIGFLFVHANALPLTSYLGGLHNDIGYGFELAIDWVLLLPAALVCLVVLLVRLWVSWPEHIRAVNRLRLLRVLVVVAVGLCAASLFFPIWPPGLSSFPAGFSRYVQTNADIPAIRAWLGTLDPNVCTGEDVRIGKSKKEPGTDWPEPVASLHPRYVSLHLDRGKYPVVRLGWATRDAVWGVEIGPEDMEIPETLPRREVKIGASTMYEHDEYRLPVGPGVYVWLE